MRLPLLEQQPQCRPTTKQLLGARRQWRVPIAASRPFVSAPRILMGRSCGCARGAKIRSVNSVELMQLPHPPTLLLATARWIEDRLGQGITINSSDVLNIPSTRMSVYCTCKQRWGMTLPTTLRPLLLNNVTTELGTVPKPWLHWSSTSGPEPTLPRQTKWPIKSRIGTQIRFKGEQEVLLRVGSVVQASSSSSSSIQKIVCAVCVLESRINSLNITLKRVHECILMSCMYYMYA